MVSKYDILEIGSRAKKDAQKGNTIINGCVGTFRDDNHKLIAFPMVIRSLQIYSTNYLEYAPVLGTKMFGDGVLKWVFGETYEHIKNNQELFVGATMGGTGAVYSAFKYFSKKNGTVILPDICWPNYFTIANESNVKTLVYPLFDNGVFNFDGLKKAIENALITNNEVLIVINDPCENPTGYSFTSKEYEKLFSLLKAFNIEKKNVDVLFDIAYLDYSNKRPILFDLVRNSYDFDIYFAFSASKSFSVYGIRCGALICFAKSIDEYLNIVNAIGTISRGSISCPNNEAIGTFAKLLNDNDSCKEISNELINQRQFLSFRATKAKEMLIANKIEFLPYYNGFFITIITKKDAYALCDLLERMHIYLVPISKTYVRIALCALTTQEMELVVHAIHNFEM